MWCFQCSSRRSFLNSLFYRFGSFPFYFSNNANLHFISFLFPSSLHHAVNSLLVDLFLYTSGLITFAHRFISQQPITMAERLCTTNIPLLMMNFSLYARQCLLAKRQEDFSFKLTLHQVVRRWCALDFWPAFYSLSTDHFFFQTTVCASPFTELFVRYWWINGSNNSTKQHPVCTLF